MPHGEPGIDAHIIKNCILDWFGDEESSADESLWNFSSPEQKIKMNSTATDMKLKIFFLLFGIGTAMQAQQLPRVDQVMFRKDTFNIVRFGGKSDATSLNTGAIAKAIEKCHDAGGGTVLIPAGFWVSGPIELKSNVNLHIAEGAVLQFSDNTGVYPLVRTNWEGLDAIRAQSPIYAKNIENAAITGKGVIDGAGQAWRPVKKNKMTPPEWSALVKSGGFLNDKKDTWYPTERALRGSTATRPGVIAEGFDIKKAEEIKEFLRPNMVSLVNIKRFLMEGVTIQNSPAWCIHPLLSQHLTFRDITVRNPWNAQNGDGIDIESCRYVLIENSVFDVGDDGICIKSGRDEEGRKRGVPTEDVIIRNSTVFHGHGGFVVGSEMSGGARNIHVYDCNFLGTDIGLRFKTTRGRGGVVENIFIRNIRMNDIGGAAILFDMYYMAKDPLAMFGGDENPSIEFQPVTEATPVFRNISISDVICKGAETAVFVRGLPEMNVRNVTLENISVESRKGVVCIEGENITIRNANFVVSEDKTVMQVQNSKNVTFDNIGYNKTDLLLNLTGERTQNIRLLNTDAKSASTEVLLGEKVKKDALKKK
jgi:DNA sulfur modification protein DndE